MAINAKLNKALALWYLGDHSINGVLEESGAEFDKFLTYEGSLTGDERGAVKQLAVFLKEHREINALPVVIAALENLTSALPRVEITAKDSDIED